MIPTPYRYSPYDTSFSPYVTKSIVAHVLILLFFSIRAVWLPEENIIIQSAMRVDLVALPDKVTAPPSAPAEPSPPTPTAKPEIKTAPPPSVKPIEKPKVNLKDAQRKAFDRLKASSAIDKLKQEVAERDKPKTPAYKGNALSEGSSLSGLQRIDFDRYYGVIETAVRTHWNLPGWLEQSGLKAQALVLIDADGSIKERRIVTSSGNETFDAHVLAAIDAANPFAAPPAKIKDLLAIKGIIFNFPRGQQ